MIFLSYRRGDTAGHAGRLFDRLAERFGREQVFMDVDTIRPGEDFAAAVVRQVHKCQVLIALIGDDWVESFRPKGHPPKNTEDFVRMEIVSAMERGIPVIPVLVEGVSMPGAEELPEYLHPLLRFQAVEIRDPRFDSDARELIQAIERLAPRRARSPFVPDTKKRRRTLGLGLGLGLIAAALAVVFFLRPVTPDVLSGRWRGETQDSGGHTFPVTFEFRIVGRQLLGTVQFPAGTGSIEEGTIQGRQISFITRHVPQFQEESVVTRFAGELHKGELHLTMPSGGAIREFVVRRVPNQPVKKL